jgi:hypothetical protein
VPSSSQQPRCTSSARLLPILGWLPGYDRP